MVIFNLAFKLLLIFFNFYYNISFSQVHYFFNIFFQVLTQLFA